MRTKATPRAIWTGTALAVLCLALPLSAQPQSAGTTAETFKAGGPIPYKEYVRKTGGHAPGARPKSKPKLAAAKPATPISATAGPTSPQARSH